MNAPWWSTLFILSTLFTTGLPRGSAQDLNYETPYTFYPIFITNSWALFNTPACIAIDAGGNLYVTDQNSATVRFLYPDLTNWLVSTIAGSANGYGISDGTNSSARFSNPIGIARDLQGNLFVVDSSATIRKISPQVSGNLTNWVVTTIAGVAGNRGYADGIGVDAQFYSPSGIALDSAGNLYVVDSGYHTVRKLAPFVSAGHTSWLVTTIAGQAGTPGSTDGPGDVALFSFPNAITVDPAGNLYLTDVGNHTIRQLSPTISGGQTNYLVRTIAGIPGVSGSTDGTSDIATFASPYGILLLADGTLYVTDGESGTIRQLVPSAGHTNWLVSTIAGRAGSHGSVNGLGGAARFESPNGLAIDSLGELFVVDGGANTIRKLVPTIVSGVTNWIVTTIAGHPGYAGGTDGLGIGGELPLNRPVGIAWDKSGSIFVSEASAFRKLTPAPDRFGTHWTISTIATLGAPGGVVSDDHGAFFVVDVGADVIKKIFPNPAAGQTNWLVSIIAGATHSSGSADGTGSSARFSFSGGDKLDGIARDGAGNLYVSDPGNHTIRKVTPTISSGVTNWIVTTIAGLAGQGDVVDGTNSEARFLYPAGITTDSVGKVFVCDSGTIRQLTPVGTGQTNWLVTTIAGAYQFGDDRDGISTSALFLNPNGIVSDNSTSNLFVVGQNLIRKMTNSTAYSAWGVSTIAEAIAFGSGIAIDDFGTLFVTGAANNTIGIGHSLTAQPTIVLNAPQIVGDQIQIEINITSGWATSFKLFEALQPNGPWTLNPSTSLFINRPGVSYIIGTSYPGGAARFYRVQSP